MLNMKKSVALAATATLMASLLSACSGNNVNQPTNGVEPTPSTPPAATNEPVDPDAKFDPPVEATFGVTVSDAVDNFTEDTWNTSVWIKEYNDKYGIDIKAKWFVKGADASNQKASVAIASGDIPDIMAVNKAQLAALSRTNLIRTDLAEVYEQYASELTKSIITEEGSAALDSATFDGKLLAIPGTNSAIDGSPFTWVRQDWLDQLGLSVPKTTEELYEVMKAFVEQDPDGNGKPDTVGLMLSKEFLSPGLADAIGIFNAFDAYPNAWVRDSEGKLVFGNVQPEVKDALDYLARLYQEGLIEQDFAAKDSAKASELAAAGQVGLNMGAMWNGMYPLQQTKDNFPDSDWRAYGIVSKDDQPANPQIKLNVENYYVVRADYEHPEVLLKLLNFWTDLNYGDATQEEYDRFLGGAPAPGHHYTVAKAWKPMKNLDAHLKVTAALESGDTSELNAEEMGYYNGIRSYEEGDNSQAQLEKVFGATGSFVAMNEYVEGDLFMMDEFYGAYTDAMKTRMNTIEQATIEYYTKVIMGNDSTANFDKFVTQLDNLGLKEVTAEVNEWDASR